MTLKMLPLLAQLVRLATFPCEESSRGKLNWPESITYGLTKRSWSKLSRRIIAEKPPLGVSRFPVGTGGFSSENISVQLPVDLFEPSKFLALLKELLALETDGSTALLRKRSANGGGITNLVSTGFNNAMKGE